MVLETIFSCTSCSVQSACDSAADCSYVSWNRQRDYLKNEYNELLVFAKIVLSCGENRACCANFEQRSLANVTEDDLQRAAKILRLALRFEIVQFGNWRISCLSICHFEFEHLPGIKTYTGIEFLQISGDDVDAYNLHGNFLEPHQLTIQQINFILPLRPP